MSCSSTKTYPKDLLVITKLLKNRTQLFRDQTSHIATASTLCLTLGWVRSNDMQWVHGPSQLVVIRSLPYQVKILQFCTYVTLWDAHWEFIANMWVLLSWAVYKGRTGLTFVSVAPLFLPLNSRCEATGSLDTYSASIMSQAPLQVLQILQGTKQSPFSHKA